MHIYIYVLPRPFHPFHPFHPFETSHGSTACGSQDDWWSQVSKTEKEPELVELRSYIGSQHFILSHLHRGVGVSVFFFFPKQFTVGVLNATLDLAALVLVGVVGFLGSEVVLSPVVSHCLRLSPFMWGVGVGWCGRLLGL